MGVELKPVKFLVCVDDTSHARAALRFACSQAKKRNGVVDVLHIMDTSELESFPLIANKMRAEKRVKAEALLQSMVQEAENWAGITPTLLLREGIIGEAILAATEEDFDANLLVIGADPKEGGHTTKLISWLTSQLGQRLLIPLLVVPGNLTEMQIEQLS